MKISALILKLIVSLLFSALAYGGDFTKFISDDAANIAEEIKNPLDLISFSQASKVCNNAMSELRMAEYCYKSGIEALDNKDLKAARLWFLLSNKIKPLDSQQLSEIPLIVKNILADIKFNIIKKTGNLSCVVKDPFFDLHLTAIFERLADNKNDCLAQNNLGNLYLYGLGVEASNKKAIDLYSFVADKNDILGILNLAWTYDNKVGLTKKAFELYKLLISREWDELNSEDKYRVTLAHYAVGQMYLSGRGINLDEEEGLKFITLAANQEYREAQYTLAWYFEQGVFLPQNKKEAARLYALALAQGHPHAGRALAGLKVY